MTPRSMYAEQDEDEERGDRREDETALPKIPKTARCSVIASAGSIARAAG